jgi:hypothetical protein
MITERILPDNPVYQEAHYRTTETERLRPRIVFGDPRPWHPTLAWRIRNSPILSGILFGVLFIAVLACIYAGMLASVRYGDGVAVIAALLCGCVIALAFGKRRAE